VTFTLQELAEMSGGELVGEGAEVITGVASLEEATPGQVSFFAVEKYLPQLRRTRASAVFVPRDFVEATEAAQIRVADPPQAFHQLVLKFVPPPVRFTPGIHPSAVIAPDAELGARVCVQAHAVIEAGTSIGDDVVIGANTYIGHETRIGAASLIYPLVSIRERTVIGARVIIHSGAVIGADGFGFEVVDGKQRKIPQLGFVQIDDDVEIGANTTIDRARFGRTWIKEGAKLDNLVQIGHNVVFGKHSTISAQSGVAGTTRIGDHVVIGAQAGITDHVEIGDHTLIGAKAGVSKDIPANSGIWWGIPAVPLRDSHEQLAWVRRLGKLFTRVKALEKKLEL
jgi:UDP-3-O-[3-hydroxymyristoyl] glucosamine N-acyltransferase